MLVLELFLFIPVTRGEKGQRGARGEGKTRGNGIVDGRERILMSLPLFSLSSDCFFSSAFCLLSYLWVKLCRGSSCSCSWIRSKLQSHLTWLQQLSPTRMTNLSRNFLTMCNRRYQQIFLNIVPSFLPACLPPFCLPSCLLAYFPLRLPSLLTACRHACQYIWLYLCLSASVLASVISLCWSRIGMIPLWDVYHILSSSWSVVVEPVTMIGRRMLPSVVRLLHRFCAVAFHCLAALNQPASTADSRSA